LEELKEEFVYRVKRVEKYKVLIFHVGEMTRVCISYFELTPKIPSVFLPISAVSDLVGGFHFSTQKNMRI
jgi:hypothetical protein